MLSWLQTVFLSIQSKGKKICAQDFDEIEIAKLKSKGSEKEKIANCANHQPARKQSMIIDDDDNEDDYHKK